MQELFSGEDIYTLLNTEAGPDKGLLRMRKESSSREDRICERARALTGQ